MEFNRLSLVHQLGDEIILGCDMFDANDVWDILHNESREELNKLADDVRKYVAETYKEGVTHTAEFLEKQIEYWVFQYRWRYKVSVDLGAGDDHTEVAVFNVTDDTEWEAVDRFIHANVSGDSVIKVFKNSLHKK